MSVNPSGKTSGFEMPYSMPLDAPVGVPTVTKAIAERVNAIFASFKGDATLATTGVLTIANGAVTEPKIGAGAVAEAKIGDGAVTSRKAKLTKGVVAATANLALTRGLSETEYQDVPGAELKITPAVASRLFVTAIFSAQIGAWAQGSISLDGGAENAAVVSLDQNTGEGSPTVMGTQVYELSLSAAAHTIKLRARAISLGGVTVLAPHTRFMYELVAA